MFWDRAYTPSANIEALLKKENATVEEFLDDEDILQECKSQKKSIVNYFTRPDVIKRLIEFIITEPPEEIPMAERFRHANMACEILTLGLPSLDEKLLADADILKTLYSYLENEPPLNPLLSSFFSKTFSMLFSKKAEQDWFLYQQMCLQLLEYIKSQNNFLDLICKHFATPIIPDLIMHMMREVEGGQIKRNLYEWLTEDKLVERLIAILGNAQQLDKHANVAEFLCDLIRQGRQMRQTEQENDSFEPAFNGSNPILKRIEDIDIIESLLNVILEPNAQESAIVSGISVVLTLIKPSVLNDEIYADRSKFLQNREKEIHQQILTTVIRVIAPRLKDFTELLQNPPNKPDIMTTAGKISPPFGKTRLQICRVFTVLLQTNNDDIAKAICETDFFDVLLRLFKSYCWNNFLHSEVEKCLQFVFYAQLSNQTNSTQGSTSVNDGSKASKASNNDLEQWLISTYSGNGGGGVGGVGSSAEGGGVVGGGGGVPDSGNGNENENDIASEVACDDGDAGNNDDGTETKMETDIEKEKDNEEAVTATLTKNETADVIGDARDCDADDNNIITDKEEKKDQPNDDSVEIADDTVVVAAEQQQDLEAINVDGKTKSDGESDSIDVPSFNGPSALQTHLIVNCRVISKLIDCWQYNTEMQNAEKGGRRLGYMGHLIQIFKHINCSITEFEHIGALIECNLSDAAELELWHLITNAQDGHFTIALAVQNRMLANCNAQEASDYTQQLAIDFLNDNSTMDYLMTSNMMNNLDAFEDTDPNFGRHLDEDEDEDDDDNYMVGDGHTLFGKSSASTSALQIFGVTNNPWDNLDPFTDLPENSNTAPWATDFNSDNFADFDAHFSSFANDLGESLRSTAATTAALDDDSQRQESKKNPPNITNTTTTNINATNSLENNDDDSGEDSDGERLSRDIQRQQQLYDDNANVEKTLSASTSALNLVDKLRQFQDENDDNAHNERMASSIVRTLASVMQDSEDDYEDDEGMWTKPFPSDISAVEQSPQEQLEQLEQQHGDGNQITEADITASSQTLPNGTIGMGKEDADSDIKNIDELNDAMDNACITTKKTAPIDRNITGSTGETVDKKLANLEMFITAPVSELGANTETTSPGLPATAAAAATTVETTN